MAREAVVAKQIAQGQALIQQERYQDALVCFDRALVLDKSNAKVHILRGNALRHLERYEDAIQAYDQALELKAESAWAWCCKGLAYRQLKRDDDALACFERALALLPTYAEAAQQRAAALYRLERFEEALPTYERAIELAPRHAGMNRFRCKTLVQLKRYAEAARAYEQALALWPDSIELRLDYGSILLIEHRNEDALTEFECVLANEPGNTNALVGKAAVYAEQHRYEDVLVSVDSALQVQPNQPYLWHLRGHALSWQQKYEDALAAYERALSLDAANVEAWEAKGEMLQKLDRHDEALAAYDETLKIDSKRVAAWKAKVAIFGQIGRFEDALAAATEAERALPESAELRSLRKLFERGVRRTIPDKRLRLRDGRTMGYLDYGDPAGMAIFCCHGIPGSRLDFPDDEDLLRSLHGRIVVPDRPGYGLSDFQRRRKMLDWPNDVAQLADHLGIERFIVLGVSGGGAYAAACARTLPHRVIRLALVSSAAPKTLPEHGKRISQTNVVPHVMARLMPWPLYWPFVDVLAWMTKKSPLSAYRASGKRFLKAERALFVSMHLPPAEIERITEPFRQGGRGDAWDMRLLARSWGFKLDDITVETYLWHGKRDTLAPPAMGHYLARRIPNCHATFYPDEGHMLINAHWQEILERLTKEPMQARQ